MRENAILPVGSNDQVPDYEYTDGLILRIYRLMDCAETTVYDIDDEESLHVKAVRDGDSVTVYLNGKHNDTKIQLVNVK